jgi:chitinase
METKTNWLLTALASSVLAACGGGNDAAIGMDAKAALAAGACPAESPEWDAAVEYGGKDICVSHNNATWASTWYSKGVEPTSTPWMGWEPRPTAAPAAAPPPPSPSSPVPGPLAASGRQAGAYFGSWDIYRQDSRGIPGRDYHIADIHNTTSLVGGKPTRVADQLTFINYAFGNIYPKNNGFECATVQQAESLAPGFGGDVWADFGNSTLPRQVNNTATSGRLAGNFGQLKLLKAEHPHLKVFISLGGWTWSKHFSKAAKTDALRKQLVSSCIKKYIKGDLDTSVDSSGYGGAGSAKGLFDGIDVDWEFPGVEGDKNSFDPVNDKQNFTLLMQEFRRQLDAQGLLDGKRYLLTAAIGAGLEKIAHIEPQKLSLVLDWVNLMSYDFHGVWEGEDKTNFHAPLFHDPLDPSTDNAATYSANDAVMALIDKQMPSKKIVLGVPFYGRGWSGVSAGPQNSLYRPVGGGAPTTIKEGDPGFDDYKVIKLKPGSHVFNATTVQMSVFTTTGEWWSYDSPQTLGRKMQYVRDKNLLGAFAWDLSGDANGELSSAVLEGLKK